MSLFKGYYFCLQKRHIRNAAEKMKYGFAIPAGNYMFKIKNNSELTIKTPERLYR